MSIKDLINSSYEMQCHKCQEILPKQFMRGFDYRSDPNMRRYYCKWCTSSGERVKCFLCDEYISDGMVHISPHLIKPMDSYDTYYNPKGCKKCFIQDGTGLQDERYRYTDQACPYFYTGKVWRKDKKSMEETVANSIKEGFEKLNLREIIKDVLTEELYKPGGVGAELAKRDFEKKAEVVSEGL